MTELFETYNVNIRAAAKAVGVTESMVRQWRAGLHVSAEMVPRVERGTGIPRHLLRPDLWKPGDQGYATIEATRFANGAIAAFNELRLELAELSKKAEALAKELNL